MIEKFSIEQKNRNSILRKLLKIIENQFPHSKRLCESGINWNTIKTCQLNISYVLIIEREGNDNRIEKGTKKI